MDIAKIKEEIGKYERYLLGVKHGAPTFSLRRHITQVCGHIIMIASGIDHEMDVAERKKDARKLTDLVGLSIRCGRMMDDYMELGRKIGIPNLEPAKGQTQ